MNEKKITQRKWIPVFILTALLFISGTILIYIKNLNQAVADANIASMKELSSHDSKTIENYLNNVWEEMEAVANRLRLYDCKTVEDVQIRLNLEKSSLELDEIYLLSEDGKMYTAAYMISDTDDEILQCFQEHSEKFVHRSNGRSGMHTESQKETLLFGIRIDGLQIGNISFMGMVVQSEINVIQNSLKIDSFGGQGYSSVIDYDGNYIVNINRVSSLGEQVNFFEHLSRGKLAGGQTVHGMKELCNSGESFTLSYTTPERESRILTVIPLKAADWLFIMDLSQDVFKDQSRRLIVMTVFMMGVVLVIFLILVHLLYRQSITAVRSQAEARARSEFLSSMSHEIRTPLNGLIGLNHLMKAYINNPAQLSEYIEKSANTTQYLFSLVNDILDMSKLQSNHFEMASAPLNLEQMLDNVLSMQRENIAGHEIQLEVQKEWKALNIIGDELRIKQVLMNVLSNAAKFTPTGGSICVTVSQELFEPGKVRTIIQIADTGIGISEEFQKVIFNSFTQERNKSSDSQKGTGLGMAISYLLMKQMGGNIRVESCLGHGSTFTIEFPAEVTDEIPCLKVAETAAENDNGPAGPLNILLAEDNELNAEILIEILGLQGFTVTHAENGKKAVEAFENSAVGAYDVILMDVQMPILDGYEATRIIRQMNREDAENVLIFACTANAFKDDKERAMESGMDDFLPKPVDIQLLLQKMKSITKKNRKEG